ncbi:alpha,alpha-trehalose-phosphate synthase subunit [Aspergillus luchuensis]|uniref:Alpha,alpha-trehalose-phosphate synthase subunit n=1 Tax=Aspergillus kawachii TaxID=1069201 RepID=A0A146FGY1_ASPKA|nr:alpha,alpha-trehalose-phosphate synthase subunit [Aspergillus luchuensis]
MDGRRIKGLQLGEAGKWGFFTGSLQKAQLTLLETLTKDREGTLELKGHRELAEEFFL